MQSAQSDFPAFTHRNKRDGGRWVMPFQSECKDACLPPKAAKNHRMLDAADLLTRRINQAERAQAELFGAILEDEFSRLMKIANRIERPLDWLKHPDTGGAQSLAELMQIHTLHMRIDEVRRLLEALQDRFLHTQLDCEPQPT